LGTVARALAEAALVVDALLGTGLTGAARGLTAQVIEQINRSTARSSVPVVSLDLPSGLGSDSGALLGHTVRATLTVTFAGLKRSLLLQPAAEHAGRVVIVPIGVPEVEVARGVSTFLIDESDIRQLFPPRPVEAHKGTYGHLLVIAGSVGKTGAAALAGPLVVAADALSALAGHLDLLGQAPAARILTPHPGEMARMLGLAIAQVQGDRIETVRRFCLEHRVHLVLKGARSVLGSPDG